jgi:predicted RNA-binding Zn ribbon-like protein
MTTQLSEEQCLAFANTVSWHASAKPIDSLQSYDDLLTWAHRAKILGAQESELLAAYARRRPDESTAVLQRAVAVREAIYAVLVAHVHAQAPATSDLALLNAELAIAMERARVAPATNGYRWTWASDTPRLDAPLWPLVRAAANLLTAPDLLARVGQCADDRGCGWLFLDTSKNRSRRWCDINDCGNRAKQRRHYARTKGSSQAS